MFVQDIGELGMTLIPCPCIRAYRKHLELVSDSIVINGFHHTCSYSLAFMTWECSCMGDGHGVAFECKVYKAYLFGSLKGKYLARVFVYLQFCFHIPGVSIYFFSKCSMASLGAYQIILGPVQCITSRIASRSLGE